MRATSAQLKARPAFFDLYRIKQPVTAVVSFGHRVSGVFIALLVPFLVYLLETSLAGPDGWQRAAAITASGWARVVAVLLLWAFAHHVFAGIRHLLFDAHVGARLNASRTSAWVVLGAEACVLVVILVALA